MPNALANPQLELRKATNKYYCPECDWQSTQMGGIITNNQAMEIRRAARPDTNAGESAIIVTALVRGANNTTGNALVEVYALP